MRGSQASRNSRFKAQFFENVHFIFQPHKFIQKLGFAPARNAAQREAGGSYDYLYVDEQYPEEFSV